MGDFPSQPAAVPTEIGGYEIQRILGAGGMATVYAALQKQPRRTVAIKVMRGAGDAEAALRRFRREIEILGRLRHPYVAQVFSAGVHVDPGGPVPYYVMEYVPGAKTILEYAATKELSLRERLKLFVKVCAAVEHGHRNKILHRDLKPGNILIDEEGGPKIIDFGVARVLEWDVTSVTMQTEEGRLIGTIQYMAPEQLDTTRRDLDGRVDVYALGVVLFRLLTGRPPQDLFGVPMFTAAQIIREDPPTRPSAIRPELKGDLETITLRALAKDPNRRYRSAGALGRDLVRYLARKPIKASKAGWWYRGRLFALRHRVALGTTGVVAIVVALAAAALYYQRELLTGDNDAPPEPVAVTTPLTGNGPTPTPPAPAGPSTEPAGEPFRLAAAGTPVRQVRFDPSGAMLGVVSDDLSLSVWRLDDRRQTYTAADHDDVPRFLAFSDDGAWLASAADDGRVVLLARRTGDLEWAVRHPCDRVEAMAVDPTGARVAIACADLTVRVLAPRVEPLSIRGARGGFRVVAFDDDGDRVAAVSERGALYVWSAQDGIVLARRNDVDGLATQMAFVGEDEIAITTEDAATTVWSLADERSRPRRVTSSRSDHALTALARDGAYVARVTDSGVEVWTIADGRRAGSAPIPDDHATPSALAIDDTGRWVAVGTVDGTVDVLPVIGP